MSDNQSKFQLGQPMDPPTMAAMDKNERLFWQGFLNRAMALIRENRAEGKAVPWEAPDWLKEKYEEALRQYDGAKWCQMHQLAELFQLQEDVIPPSTV